MAKKSKTQRAKASAKRAAKKERAKQAEVTPVVEEEPKKHFGRKKDTSSAKDAQKAASSQKQSKKADAKPKKKRFAFLSAVRSEMRRVTWPTKQDVLQWTGVVVLALLFFGVFVTILDDWVVTPILLAISSLSGLGA